MADAHLLPASATKLEKSIGATFARIDRIAVPIRDVRSPQLCPPELLPWLAWHYRVEEWSADWSDAVKRNVILASYETKNINRRAMPWCAQFARRALPTSII